MALEQEVAITTIDRNGYTVDIKFSFGNGLEKYFRQDHMKVEYPFDCSAIPDSILTIPFVSNVLPIIWLTDSRLIVHALDADFYSCIPDIKRGYETMYPHAKFLGQIVVNHVQKNSITGNPKSAMFYSGGIDSVDTFVRHHEERPELLSIWGSDIEYGNAEGWKRVHSAVEYAANRFSLVEHVIHSQFRMFLNEATLTSEFSPLLHDGWWHGVQHGIGLLGHVAPLAYINHYGKMYIASTFTTTAITCASSPLIDNHVHFAGCKVYHDGFDFTRQEKVRHVIEFCRNKNIEFPLHVCWRSQTGQNCCVCEKCLRTISALLAENANPEFFGFSQYAECFSFAKHRRTVRLSLYDDRSVGNNAEFWSQISSALKQIRNYPISNNASVEKFLLWVRNYDFKNKDNWIKPLDAKILEFLQKVKRKIRQFIRK